ncbi:sodium/hydrogen exchanger family protein [Cercophora newfieldiana]|uniref:Sodium/hydrogen exchanger family protein n=1 Tax=Cercophora newfieldiana TaxID=92897 RepID=A0AA40CR12_9PEZI|nr:sodium/hydrogen exchanger family protein [Cercophora newfieldiana]
MSATTSSAAAATPSGGNRAPSQGGVIEGANPSHYNPKDPITMFIIQAGLIIIVCHILHWPLKKIRQPRVIAEVIGGIILGPSVMGRIPGFRAAIFPAESIPNLTLVANLGLVLYLFLIGLETDVRFLVSNWRVATSVAFAGMALPFGLGCALAWGLYHQFAGDEGILSIGFSVYMLFIGVAIAITAFPVLCRILTELKLLDTSVGVITLSAGVANDVVGWILLALCVALVNAGSGLTALWILMACLGYMLFLLYIVKPALVWLLRRTGSIENGPSQTMVSVILLIALASAFFTGIIGVHAIFGGFMVGLILPREGGFNIKVTEKLEDLIGAIFLPLYFTLSGLNTNLGLLNSGIAWGYVVAVTLVAFFSKLFGATVAARLNGLVWRESFAIGVLMSCKGLVELIVLNIGLQARILSTRTFTIFVVMALITTFSTTPLATLLYPPWYQEKLKAWRRGEIDWDTGEALPTSSNPDDEPKPSKPGATDRVRQLLVYLTLDNMPSILDLVSLFGNPSSAASQSHPADRKEGSKQASERAVRAHGLRLLQLTDRDSSVMTVSQVDEYNQLDPVVNIFRTLGQLHKIAISGEVAVMPEPRFAEALVSKSTAISSDLILIPWDKSHVPGGAQSVSEAFNSKLAASFSTIVKPLLQMPDHNLAIFFPKPITTPAGTHTPNRRLTRTYSFSDVKNDIPTTVPVTNLSHHVFLPYFGGADDQLALIVVLQLCERTDVTATVVCFTTGEADASFTATSSAYRGDNVKFETVVTEDGYEAALERASTETQPEGEAPSRHLVVVGRRVGADAVHGKPSYRVVDEVRDGLGAVAAHFVASGLRVDVLAIQARTNVSA